MKRINTKLIQSLRPCSNRLDNWMTHYSKFYGTFHEFLDLTEITAQDKVWVACRLISPSARELFAWDCSFRATACTYADAAAYAADAAYAAYAVADAAAYAAAYAAAVERMLQIECLYFITNNDGRLK